MKKESFSYSFVTSKPATEVFRILLDVKRWWSGLYEETIDGKSQKTGDEFTFKAGGGVHYSKQKLVELIPDQKIEWLVTESVLSFLKHRGEWNDSMIRFELAADGKNTRVTFTHEGLVPQIECYDSCASAWTNYLDNLKEALKAAS